jgi:hypothetical protein
VRTHTCAPGTSPKLKSLQDLSIRVNPEVTKKVMQHAGGSMDACISICTVTKSSIHRSSRPIPSVEFSPTDGRRMVRALRPNQPSEVSSHDRHESEQTLNRGGTHTFPSPRWYGWRCRRRPWPQEHRHVLDSGSNTRSRAAKAQRMKTIWNIVIHCQSVS